MFNNMAQDIRFALRSLTRNPTYTLTATLALAVGIGANSALFSVVNGVLFESLPYRDSGELVMLWEDSTRQGGTDRVPVAAGNFHDWRLANPAFEDLAALFNASLRVTSVDEPLVPLVHQVTANYFSLLGVEPFLGRTFRPGDDEPGEDRVVILSYGLWQRVYGGEASIVGTSIELDEEPYTVLGVLPANFHSVHIFAVQPDLWVPLVLAGRENDRGQRGLAVYGRLSDGRSLSEVQAAMTTLANRLAEEHPETNEGWGVRVVTVQEEATGSVRTTLLVLLGAVGFVLLIACANVANLTLARAAGRSREIGLRRALGASGSRLTRLLLVESLLLSLMGGGLGLFLAAVGLGPLLSLVPSGAAVPFLDRVALDGSVLMFTGALAIGTGLLFGLAPVRAATTRDVSESIRLGSRSEASGPGRLGDLLVVAEVTLALVLLAGAGLLIQSFQHLKGFHPGFDSEQVLTVRNSLRGPAFAERSQRVAHFDALAERLGRIAGARVASATSFPPPLNPFRATTFQIPGEPVEPGFEPTATVRAVLPRYPETMGIPLLAGRPLEASDREDAPPVVVINETLARLYFGGRSAVGESLVITSNPSSDVMSIDGERQIVGVVGSVRTAGASPEPLPVIYVPYAQAPVPVMSLVVRTEGDPEVLLREVEQTAWSMPGDINVYGTETLAMRIDRFEWRSDASALLLGAFALLALVLGAAGIYAVVSVTVTKRAREIGLRMALGATGRSVLTMVVRDALKLAAVGISIGTVLSLVLARYVESLLYGVGARDVATLSAVALMLLLVAAAASFVPAWRASRIDPMSTIRHD